MNEATATTTNTYDIEWGNRSYGPFTTHAEARAHQREHQMTGSSIVPTH